MNRPLTSLVRPELLDIAPYVPGRTFEALKREYALDQILKFASNENPLGPSPRAVEAIRRAATQVHRYADAGAVRLREVLAEQLAVTPAHIVPTCGSNEMILLATQAFLRPGDEVVIHHPSFLMYPIAVREAGGTPVFVKGEDHGIDLDAMIAAITPRTRMIFLCSPNNPTGDIVREPEFDRFLARIPDDVCVILDEAYHEFVLDPAYPRAIARIDALAHRPILVLRTFSKAHALASLRIGYGVMRPELAAVFERTRQPFNANGLAQEAAIASLEDETQVTRSVAANRNAMGPLVDGLRALGVHVRESHGNFLFCRFPVECPALCKALERQGLIVRPLTAFGVDAFYSRITVGLPAENDRLLEALRVLLPATSAR